MTTTTAPTNFQALTDSLLAQLATGAGEHRIARFHVDVERDPGDLTPKSFRDYQLSTEDTEMEDAGKPFVGGQTFDPPFQALVTATNAIDPLYMVDYFFWREADTWRYAFAMQSLAEKNDLDALRGPIDESLRVFMLSMQQEGWMSSTFERRGARPLRFVSLDKSKRLTKHEITDSVLAFLERYDEFFSSAGLELQVLSARIESKTPKAIAVDTLYGAMKQDGQPR